MAESTPQVYEPLSNTSLEKAVPSTAKRSKWMIIGSVAALIGLIVVGVTAGVVVSQHNKKNNATSGTSTPGSSSPSNNNPTGNSNDPNSPSNFKKDPNLIRSFYGMAYAPEGVQLPDCGATLAQVIVDIQLMSQLTKTLRLYGADCNQSALVLEAIKQTKVDMTVYLGNYNLPNDNDTAYNRQRDIIKDAILTYGTDHIEGVTVGNEYMLNYLNDNGGTDPNTPLGDTGAQLLIANIQDTRAQLAAMNLSKKMPVGNSEAGYYFNTHVLAAIDYGLSNVHPWFANVSINDAASWTNSYFQETNVQPAALLPNNPKMYIAETGWPTQSSDAGNANNGASAASLANLQIFLDTFICQANQNGTGYFFFEYFDEKWKDITFGGVEGWWGLFNANRTLKAITIPNCPIS